MRLLTWIIVLFVLSCAVSLFAQDQGCQSVSFAVKLAGSQTFERELGNGIWFVAYPSDGYWTMRIGPDRHPKKSFDVGWSVDENETARWLLGSEFFDAGWSMKDSPRYLWFALTKKDFERLTAARYRPNSAAHGEVQNSEHEPDKVIAEIPKGLATLVISDYHLSEPHEKGKWPNAPQRNVVRDLASVSLEVTVNTPATFPLSGAVAGACPSESPNAPGAGYVPDSVTAIRVAEAVMGGRYGEEETRSLRPFTATLNEEVWTVVRFCKSWCVGLNPTVKMLKRDGRIIAMRSIYLK